MNKSGVCVCVCVCYIIDRLVVAHFLDHLVYHVVECSRSRDCADIGCMINRFFSPLLRMLCCFTGEINICINTDCAQVYPRFLNVGCVS